ncbi:1810_t:CDS:1, partial [Racocetra persica]
KRDAYRYNKIQRNRRKRQRVLFKNITKILNLCKNLLRVKILESVKDFISDYSAEVTHLKTKELEYNQVMLKILGKNESLHKEVDMLREIIQDC